MRLPREQFWLLGVEEWHMMLAGAALSTPAPMGRADVEKLARLYPDERTEHGT